MQSQGFDWLSVQLPYILHFTPSSFDCSLPPSLFSISFSCSFISGPLLEVSCGNFHPFSLNWGCPRQLPRQLHSRSKKFIVFDCCNAFLDLTAKEFERFCFSELCIVTIKSQVSKFTNYIFFSHLIPSIKR